ncbi:LysR family transcriptional regulator [Chitinophaga sancti]|uniref:DNA-binding transcriptional regulator, LysR family n=1 Tax=Chitinophaga sancti TaxID=1004 RepID=A0A1K1M7V3_9BACT|nr:LysR family transcriptional regulator [Chitinophaga sancti]WQD64570.1 LysR family transcriptional regulator [Chitinophaga sancti]WQG89806.1 LysR family transcriptional regulator [Chitinophaga sancti]SFW19228.1 DNA-binding transcriptional regulator, LysR family [Chitinophaga sancti]
MVNLEWFRTFKTIYETGSLTGAAEALYVSQPGISLHLSSLEAYVGHKLFDRSSRKLLPTERGKLLYNYILEALNKLEEAEEHFHRSTEAERPTVSVGMCFETFQFTLEPYLPTLPFNVIIKFGEYPEMLSDLDAGILDLIITPQKGDYPQLKYEPFFKERIVVVGGAKTNTAKFKKLLKADDKQGILDWLKSQIWYGTTGDMEHLRRFWFNNFDKRPDFKPNYIVPNICSILRCLSVGDGIAVVPDFLAKQELDEGKVRLIWEGSKIHENTLYFGTRKKCMYGQEIAKVKEIFLRKMVKAD